MKRSGRGRLIAWVLPVCVLGLFAGPQAFAAGSPSSSGRGFVSFREFRAQLERGTYAATRRDPSVAASPKVFSEMQQYLQKLYAGVHVRTSFVTAGAYFDCVTVDSQPSVLAAGIKHVAKPPASRPEAKGAWTTTGTDTNGRTIACPSGTIPMRRTTLTDATRFTTLRGFLTHGHGNGSSVTTGDYNYAHAYQQVTNYGGGSTINVWNPTVPIGSGGDDHSLSQEWVTGGSGAALQTAEAGWTKDPAFSIKKPVSFIYFTADGYATTGCYNLMCSGFVQTNNTLALGAPVQPCCSKAGGADDSYTQEFESSDGNWWLVINNAFIGYYRRQLYNHGQMATNATEVDFGGEVNASLHQAKWPPMGSGKPASAGFQHAAYQSAIFYRTKNLKGHWATLTPTATSPCYSIAYGPASGTTGPFFYYGGPGGKRTVC